MRKAYGAGDRGKYGNSSGDPRAVVETAPERRKCARPRGPLACHSGCARSAVIRTTPRPPRWRARRQRALASEGWRPGGGEREGVWLGKLRGLAAPSLASLRAAREGTDVRVRAAGYGS